MKSIGDVMYLIVLVGIALFAIIFYGLVIYTCRDPVEQSCILKKPGDSCTFKGGSWKW